MTPEQAWTVITTAYELAEGNAADQRRLDETTARQAEAAATSASLAVLKTAASNAAAASKPSAAVKAEVERALAVELPPDQAQSAQVRQLRIWLGLEATP